MNVIETRMRFPFDPCPPISGWKFCVRFAASPDRRTYWVECGLNSGARWGAHYDADLGLCLSARRHGVYVPAANVQSAEAELARAADRMDGIDSLTPIEEVPGVHPCRSDEPFVRVGPHRWYTRTAYALSLPSPEWAPYPVYDIAEGVLITLGDDPPWLIRRQDYYEFSPPPGGEVNWGVGCLCYPDIPAEQRPASWGGLEALNVDGPGWLAPEDRSRLLAAGRGGVLRIPGSSDPFPVRR